MRFRIQGLGFRVGGHDDTFRKMARGCISGA